jgi:transposase
MRPHGNQKHLEQRRRSAIQLLKTGKKMVEVAHRVGADVGSVSRWYQRYREEGERGLNSLQVPGRPTKLSEFQKEQLLSILVESPLTLGYSTDLWTLQRVSRVIKNQFGIQYHRCHIWKILNSLGMSCQKPERRALQRDEQAIQHWKHYRWPHIKKS